MKVIYKFTNKINGKSYIGQSQDLETRYKTHLRNFNKMFFIYPYLNAF